MGLQKVTHVRAELEADDEVERRPDRRRDRNTGRKYWIRRAQRARHDGDRDAKPWDVAPEDDGQDPPALEDSLGAGNALGGDVQDPPRPPARPLSSEPPRQQVQV